MSHSLKFGFVAAIVLCASAAHAAKPSADPIRPGFDEYTLAGNDDLSTGWVELPFVVNFFGVEYDGLYINNNGNVTLDGIFWKYAPSSLDTVGFDIIAPFFGDVDTTFNSDPVTYGASELQGHAAFGVNWVQVNCYHSLLHANIHNSFQLVLLDRSDTGLGNFDIEFNYRQIQWDSGQSVAGGGNSSCLGGSGAYAGYSTSTGEEGTYYELPGSGVAGAFLDSGSTETSLVQNALNSDVAGRYVFYARSGVVQLCEDLDFDGVCDESDACAGTAEDELVDESGCSIADYCPCEARWKTHGKYVQCVDRASEDFLEAGLITEAEQALMHSDAAQSSCGYRK